jgi:hypothetical protein
MSAATRNRRPHPAPHKDHLPLHLRAYLEPPAAFRSNGRDMIGTPPWALIFDTETTTDAAQSLRFGCYQLRKAGALQEAGLFHDPAALTPDERAVLEAYASERGLRYLTLGNFVDDVVYGLAYSRNAVIIGFNLPFDLSRLAISHGLARGRSMRGGFTFALSSNPCRPNIQIKHLSRRMALIQFTGTRPRQDNRRERKQGLQRIRRGQFIDVKTLAAALTSQSFSLAALADHLRTDARKHHTDDHGAALNATYIDYAMQDVEVTWQCLQKLSAKHAAFGLTETPMPKVLSEASIGKGLLKQMKVTPWRVMQPDCPPALIGQIMSSYYGGRAEVRLRRVIRDVLYCDFLSMYPTVCTLMGLWRFVIADGMRWHDATVETCDLLNEITVDALQSPETWRELTTLVRVQPEKDLFPVRTRYCDRSGTTIGLNHLTSREPLWFTLADCIASTVLNGRPPHVIEALRFEPGPPQQGLRPIRFAAADGAPFDPISGDLYRTLIDSRNAIKAQIKSASGDNRERLEGEQLMLKILANATSYGIFMELNVEDLPKPKAYRLHGPDSSPRTINLTSVEKPGPYFHPLIGTLITGAARLMLALAERLVADANLEWALCDTDSMAIARPDGMKWKEFQTQARGICDWFAPLNPYAAKGPIFKVEDINHGDDGTLQPLHCLAISAKRNVLFNRDAEGLPVIRKASAHGLGHLVAPYGDGNAPWRIPKPRHPLGKIGVERWQHDLWWQIIRAHDAGHPERVDLSYRPAMRQAARSRYGASTPDLLAWFDAHNANRCYREQVRPFNFLLTFQTRAMGPKASPVAPFSKSAAEAVAMAFDRDTGQPVEPRRLKSYATALAQYHLSPEDKFLNAEHLDRGTTRRRHVVAAGIRLIGKESNKLELLQALDQDDDPAIDYGLNLWPNDQEQPASIRRLAQSTGLARATIRKLCTDPAQDAKPAITEALVKARQAEQAFQQERAALTADLVAMIDEQGLSAIARSLGVDPSNLAKIAAGQRRLPETVAAKLKALIR